MTRFLIVNTDYPGFIDSLYAAHPGLEREPYEQQLLTRNATLFGTSDFYPRNLNALGHVAFEVHLNTPGLQQAWAREHGLKVPSTGPLRLQLRRGFVPWLRRESHAWVPRVLEAQIEELRPDVVLTHSLNDLPAAFWKRMRTQYRLLVGQIASRIPDDLDLTPFDLILSSLPNFVQRFRAAGARAEYFQLAFEPTVLQRLHHSAADGVKRDIDVSFVGSLTSHHPGRLEWLKHVCTNAPVQVWGQGMDALPAHSPVRKAYQGEAWGADMYRILLRSRITLNHHVVSLAGPYANNMRLYEATGVGTLLLTDWKENLGDILEPDTETAVYRTPQECVEKIRYYLEKEPMRAAIAGAGQERTLREHTYRRRMEQLVTLVEDSITR